MTILDIRKAMEEQKRTAIPQIYKAYRSDTIFINLRAKYIQIASKEHKPFLTSHYPGWHYGFYIP